MTDAEHMSVLYRATKAANRVLCGGDVAGKVAWDFAVDAWIYNHERGISQEFCSRRAYFLAIEAIRSEFGRSDKKKRRSVVYPNSRTLSLRCKRVGVRAADRVELPDLDGMGLFGQICKGMLSGLNQREIALRLDLSQARISQILKDEMVLLVRYVPIDRRARVFCTGTRESTRDRILALLKAVWEARTDA